MYAFVVMSSGNVFGKRSFMAVLFIAATWCAAGSASQNREKPPLLVVVSIDGLRPDYITAADEHGAKVPNLRRFLKEGAYAEGVEGVVPTVTYPSHTTLTVSYTHLIIANVAAGVTC